MSLFELGKRILGKRLDERAQREEQQDIAAHRQDQDLPLGLRVGGVVEISPIPFALLQGSLVHPAPTGPVTIASVSRVAMDDGGPLLYRAYLNRGDDGQGESFLQVLADAAGAAEITYFVSVHRDYPQTEEAQRAFLGEGYGLGDTTFKFGPAQLTAMGLSDEAAKALLAGAESLAYTREAPGGSYVAPFVATESRLDDAAGFTGMKLETHFMTYQRALPGDDRELLLIAFEAAESQDGQGARDVHVDYMVGITLPATRIKVY